MQDCRIVIRLYGGLSYAGITENEFLATTIPSLLLFVFNSVGSCDLALFTNLRRLIFEWRTKLTE